jgi:hypothetical protein
MGRRSSYETSIDLPIGKKPPLGRDMDRRVQKNMRPDTDTPNTDR